MALITSHYGTKFRKKRARRGKSGGERGVIQEQEKIIKNKASKEKT